ncbi:uncharacterized protein LOC100457405 isoform X1 [Pongo abelii]|uniref:uncharacterized protein LOC100457405 isoform X1 n=1 Tax=Pongo abelii TaxID=9601 RepID=UPI0023E7A56B|nr:uncharacterized protein LOC100457405 isoform X1 [Pongo abelii]
MASDCGPTRKQPSSQKGPSPPRACAHRPVGGETWSLQDTVQLLCGCVPRSQDFQEIEPVPCALGNNSPRQHFGIPGYPEAARDSSSSPAPGLLTLCSRLRAKPDSVCLPFFPPWEANATPTRLCLRVSLAGRREAGPVPGGRWRSEFGNRKFYAAPSCRNKISSGAWKAYTLQRANLQLY